ncbi:cell division protein FtsQ [Anaerobacterium chartisolvens]|uniref:Cell division protein FtsQ n=1 Tax=Anaerobacterium chartisolvens TaxID=1297424 RepID=A0A369B245_9FIRM|nr:FtsQ-type POTRA domain-containing protein [Anaerobacterium chartisolvens]RCX15491.1 cell division protein FtsQ [Anaerobacterium chartisolvens]
MNGEYQREYIDSEALARKKKKRKRRIKKILFWIKSIFIIALFSTTIVSLALSPLFNINSIEVTGTARYQHSDIIGTAGLVTGVNGFKAIGRSIQDIFTLSYGNAEEAILNKYPYIKSAEARFAVPDKIKITLRERVPIAFISCPKGNIIIDDALYVLEMTGKNQPEGLLMIKGLEFEAFEVGQALDIKNNYNYEQALLLLNKIRESDERNEFKLYGLISAVDASDMARLTLLWDGRINANFGELLDLDFKINFFRHIVSKSLKKQDKGFLDLTIENPSFIPGK